MAVYFVTGKLGSGKTLCCIGKIRDYLQQGRRVATNLDLNIQALTSYDSKTSVVRVPDKPIRWDLDALGQGCDESDESKYGLLVLDELGTWFNCRNWQDKGRLAVIDWFLHARKKHWDIYLIVQSIESLDSQLVNALCEHLVICKRTDRLNIPFISPVLKFMEFGGKLPKFHIAKVYYGQDVSGVMGQICKSG
jgi:KaiC/GvpD/RAD55 family RecA-like ATPase